MSLANSSCANADRAFGPVVPPSCRGGFDFTLLFEEIFFALLPSLAFLVAFSVRIWQLRQLKSSRQWSLLHVGKLCTCLSFTVIELTNLILWATRTVYQTRLLVASAAIQLLASLAVFALSHYEQTITFRSSPILNFYLLFSFLFDGVRLRTFWLLGEEGLRPVAITSSLAIGFKFVLMILEAILKPSGTSSPPKEEETASIYSLGTFWWLNKLFRQGYSRTLDQDDLYAIDKQLSAAHSGQRVIKKWYSAEVKSKNTLLFSLLTGLRWQLLAPVPSRLILIAFTYAQPFLIHRALDFIGQPTTVSSKNVGYGLIGATFLVYSGLAFTNGCYNYSIYRGTTAVRSALLDIIYTKTLDLELALASKAAPLGLVGADVERIALTLEKAHEMWSCTIEVGLAIYLLDRQIGWPSVAPITLALVCTAANTYIAKAVPSRLKIWNQSIQKRVAMTSTMLSNMKAVKMMGISQLVSEKLKVARTLELEASAGFRHWVACMNTIALIPKQLSAPFVFMIFAIAVQFHSDGGLTAARAFTTLSIIELLTTPLGKVLQALPSITASTVCFVRIQNYLNSVSFSDERTTHRLVSDPNLMVLGEKYCASKVIETELDQDDHFDQARPILTFQKASFAYSTASSPILNAITFEIRRASLAIITGPVGSGKSSLLKAILGELRPQGGHVYVTVGSISYCDQTPWIPNGTIRDTIIGGLEMDRSWFDEVVQACALDSDLAELQDGIEMSVGSRGIALSEGQKHRVALCRAVYSRASLMILEDVFRSLDSRTEASIAKRLFSPSGLLKRHGMTAVLSTHSVRHLPLADQIIVLEAGGSVQQIGPFDELSHCKGYVQDLELARTSKTDPEIEDGAQVLWKPAPVNVVAKTEVKPNTPNAAIKVTGIYHFYVASIGRWRILVLLSAAVILAFGTKFPQIWVQWWTEAHGSRSAMYIGVYFLVSGGACLCYAFLFWWMMIVIVPVSASGLHEQLLKAVVHAPLSFFTSTDAGVVLNRFSQDMGYINSQLPISLYQAIFTALLCLMQIALIAYGSKYLAAFIPVTVAVVWFLQRYYLRTSRQLRFLDLELKSPVYTAFTETLEGLATIRAFGWQSNFQKDFRAWGWFIFFYTELETFLGAVARIKEWVDGIKPEDKDSGTGTAPKDWPKNGNIEINNVTTAYSSQDKPALNNISLSIKRGQKVCIVGRTGSGKSTLMSALLRLIALQSGKICIDNHDISTIPVEIVRQSVTAIPQSPFFLPGSVILNLTLSDDHRSNELACIAALQKVGLWDIIATKGGLEADISTLSLSHGQQQLFCLARAILKKTLPGSSKILVLDEMTSGVDRETGDLMERLLDAEFGDYTVICIAHRLRMASRCDVVVVLDGGRIVQVGEPGVLLEERGTFWELCEAQK